MDEIRFQLVDVDGSVLYDFLTADVFLRKADWDAAVCTVLYAVNDDDGDFGAHRAFLRQLGVWAERVRINERRPLLAAPLYLKWAEYGEVVISAQITRITVPDRKDYVIIFELTSFEDAVTVTTPVATLLTLGDTADLPVLGSSPGRFASVDIAHNWPTIPTRWWLGVRPFQAGAITTTFEPLWDLVDGTAYGLSAIYSGIDVYGGTAVQLNYVASPLSGAVAITPSDAVAGADYDDFVGSYTPLLRCNIPVGTAVTIRCGVIDTSVVSPLSSGKSVSGSVYAVTTGGAWQTIPLPVVTLPGWFYSRDFDASSIYLEFEWSGGAGDIIIDTLTLIPYESYAHLAIGAVNAELDRTELRVQVNERGVVLASGLIGGGQAVPYVAVHREFASPAAGGVLVVAGGTPWAYAPAQDLALSCTIEARWRNYGESP